MKQIAGLGLILLCIPILAGIQSAIATELSAARASKEQLHESVVLTGTEAAVPVSMKDRDGLVFAEEYTEWRQPLQLNEIPLFIQHLFIESEDKGFFDHRGYDVTAIARAFTVNAAASGRLQGGSTITQQVVRMKYLTTEKTYERKFRELLYAAELEKLSSKEEILGMYLNEMYFGHQVYGIGAAATYYFSRPLSELSEAEMAFIAAIPNNPTLYDPLTHPDRTKKRQELLLSVLAESGVITDEEADMIKQVPITLKIKKKTGGFDAYGSYVLAELKDLIGKTEGYEERLNRATDAEAKKAVQEELAKRSGEIIASGIIIETALDRGKQQSDEKALSSCLGNGELQAGGVVIDNKSREIVSLFPGKGYRKADFNRAYQAYRQPGSAIKPLLVYGPYFESGPYTANTPIDSGPICIGSYCPGNIGGYVYGVTPVVDAFRLSHNTAAVRVLRTVGLDNAFSYLDQFGFKMVAEEDRTYSAALGGFAKGLTPLEMASAYTSFIDGTYKPAHAIRTVKNTDGDILYEWKEDAVPVWSPSTVQTMRTLLEQTVVNGTGTGIAATGGYTGAKTGTTNHYKDIWVAGLNDRYTAAIWVGVDQPKPVRYASEQKLHLRMFNQLMRK